MPKIVWKDPVDNQNRNGSPKFCRTRPNGDRVYSHQARFDSMHKLAPRNAFRRRREYMNDFTPADRWQKREAPFMDRRYAAPYGRLSNMRYSKW